MRSKVRSKPHYIQNIVGLVFVVQCITSKLYDVKLYIYVWKSNI